MIDQERINEYWKRTEQTLSVFEALKEIGYFDAPASKRHHLAVAGGLVEHSIHVTNILLDERVVRARELMLGYIEGVLAKVGGNDAQALRLIVAEAFKANAQGFLSTGKIMSLLRMEIDNADWREAKRILQDSIKPQKGKQYLACEVRPSTQADFRPIRLDIADCWPEGKV